MCDNDKQKDRQRMNRQSGDYISPRFEFRKHRNFNDTSFSDTLGTKM